MKIAFCNQRLWGCTEVLAASGFQKLCKVIVFCTFAHLFLPFKVLKVVFKDSHMNLPRCQFLVKMLCISLPLLMAGSVALHLFPIRLIFFLRFVWQLRLSRVRYQSRGSLSRLEFSSLTRMNAVFIQWSEHVSLVFLHLSFWATLCIWLHRWSQHVSVCDLAVT